jgi:replicative DNA helicase
MSALAPTRPPHSPEAEASVVGQMLANNKVVGEVVGTLLEPEHFFLPAFQALYRTILSAYYADEAVDPISIGEQLAKTLARTWACTEDEAVQKVGEIAAGQRQFSGRAVDHAKVIKQDADRRSLLELAATIERGVALEQETPIELAGLASQTAMQIATATLLTHEILSYDELGARFVQQQKQLMAARAAGIELGAYFGLSFIDSFTRGLQPTEFMIVAGEPGAGKSAVTWKAAQMFAERQMKKPQDRRVGTMVLSLEMGEVPSSTRLGAVEHEDRRRQAPRGRTDEDELRLIMKEWNARRGIPLYFNFTSTLKASQLRALVVESIRRHNVGVVVIDHMRYFDMDGRFASAIEEEEAKARFLKESIAKDLNVAVICLAHTIKSIDDDGRPALKHLRGSQMVSAHADFVGFVYRPYNHASRDDIDEGRVQRSDAEMIWSKNRHGLEGTARFHFDPSTMTIY